MRPAPCFTPAAAHQLRRRRRSTATGSCSASSSAPPTTTSATSRSASTAAASPASAWSAATARRAAAPACPTPEGDFFAIDYVAHEMGHQFGGNAHLQRHRAQLLGGNRSGSPVEPGWGTLDHGLRRHLPAGQPPAAQRPVLLAAQHHRHQRPTSPPTRAPINEVQTVSLRGFDTDGESFTLTFDGKQTAPIVRGTNYTTPASTPRSRPITGCRHRRRAAASAARAPRSSTTRASRSRFTGAPYAGTDVAAARPRAGLGDVTGFVGETAQGGPQRNGGSTVTPTGNHAPGSTAPADGRSRSGRRSRSPAARPTPTATRSSTCGSRTTAAAPPAPRWQPHQDRRPAVPDLRRARAGHPGRHAADRLAGREPRGRPTRPGCSRTWRRSWPTTPTRSTAPAPPCRRSRHPAHRSRCPPCPSSSASPSGCPPPTTSARPHSGGVGRQHRALAQLPVHRA